MSSRLTHPPGQLLAEGIWLDFIPDVFHGAYAVNRGRVTGLFAESEHATQSIIKYQSPAMKYFSDMTEAIIFAYGPDYKEKEPWFFHFGTDGVPAEILLEVRDRAAAAEARAAQAQATPTTTNPSLAMPNPFAATGIPPSSVSSKASCGESFASTSLEDLMDTLSVLDGNAHIRHTRVLKRLESKDLDIVQGDVGFINNHIAEYLECHLYDQESFGVMGAVLKRAKNKPDFLASAQKLGMKDGQARFVWYLHNV